MEEYVPKRFSNKKTKRVSNGLRAATVKQFLAGLPLIFQRNKAQGLDVCYHFTFRGQESAAATVVIRDKTVAVHNGHIGSADLHVIADSQSSLGFIRKEKNIVWSYCEGEFGSKGLLACCFNLENVFLPDISKYACRFSNSRNDYLVEDIDYICEK